jgi:hypothetical protein
MDMGFIPIMDVYRYRTAYTFSFLINQRVLQMGDQIKINFEGGALWE